MDSTMQYGQLHSETICAIELVIYQSIKRGGVVSDLDRGKLTVRILYQKLGSRERKSSQPTLHSTVKILMYISIDA